MPTHIALLPFQQVSCPCCTPLLVDWVPVPLAYPLTAGPFLSAGTLAVISCNFKKITFSWTHMLIQLPPPFFVSFYRKTLETGCPHLPSRPLFLPLPLVPIPFRFPSAVLHWNRSLHTDPVSTSPPAAPSFLKWFCPLCFGNITLGSPPTWACATLSMCCWKVTYQRDHRVQPIDYLLF